MAISSFRRRRRSSNRERTAWYHRAPDGSRESTPACRARILTLKGPRMAAHTQQSRRLSARYRSKRSVVAIDEISSERGAKQASRNVSLNRGRRRRSFPQSHHFFELCWECVRMGAVASGRTWVTYGLIFVRALRRVDAAAFRRPCREGDPEPPELEED
jgi:hypothetical protein